MAIIRHMRIKLGFLSVSRAFNNEILIQVFQNRVACPLSPKDNKELDSGRASLADPERLSSNETVVLFREKMYMCVDRDNYLELLKRRYMGIGRSAKYVTRRSRWNKEQLEKERHVHVWFHMTPIPSHLVRAGNSSTSLSIFSIKTPE